MKNLILSSTFLTIGLCLLFNAVRAETLTFDVSVTYIFDVPTVRTNGNPLSIEEIDSFIFVNTASGGATEVSIGVSEDLSAAFGIVVTLEDIADDGKISFSSNVVTVATDGAIAEPSLESDMVVVQLSDSIVDQAKALIAEGRKPATVINLILQAQAI